MNKKDIKFLIKVFKVFRDEIDGLIKQLKKLI